MTYNPKKCWSSVLTDICSNNHDAHRQNLIKERLIAQKMLKVYSTLKNDSEKKKIEIKSSAQGSIKLYTFVRLIIE